MSKVTTNKMKRRYLFIMFVMIMFGFAGISARLWHIQIVDGSKYQQMAEKQQMREVILSPKRGCIYDRNMKILAKSASVWTVTLSPIDIKQEKYTSQRLDEIATELSKILDIDKEIIIEKSKKKTYYEIIKRRIEKPLADKVIKFIKDNGINGINLEEDNKRYYPYENFAANVIGFTGSENQGLAGIESYCEKILKGESGRVVSAKNGLSRDMPFKNEQRYDAKNGNSVVLTIDEVLQHFVEKHLEIAVKEHDVRDRATGIILDVKTGEVLAMANKPDYDPNKPMEIYDKNKLEIIDSIESEKERKKELLDQQNIQWRNKAIADPYEPGTFFKIITASIALETGTTKLTDHYCCNGSITIGKQTIRCWKSEGHGDQDFSKAMMNSCNPWLINAGQKIGTEKFREYFKAFGFTELTGIDIPGEAESIYHPMKVFKTIELASSSMGQTFKVTPIQVISGVSAAINGGNLYEPHIVKQIVDENGNVVENINPILKRQVVSERTSKDVAMMCEGVVSEGSGRNAYIRGYRIGGKTGTSEKLDEKEDGQVKKYILSFLGFAPVENPRIAVLVLLDNPGSVGYGSVMAAPVVGGILSDALPYLGIEPQYTKEELEHMDVNIPHLTGESVERAKERLESMGLRYSVVGEEENMIVEQQMPTGGSKVPAGSIIVIYTGDNHEAVEQEVPDVIGCTGAQALRILGQRALNMRITGANININGTVACKQEPDAGTKVKEGSVVTVEFINTEKLE